MEEDVQPTLGNTRRIAFAIWWKLCAALWIGPFLAGFLGYLIPWGQLRFWLAIQIANVFGDAIGQYLFRSPHAMQVGIVVTFNIFACDRLCPIEFASGAARRPHVRRFPTGAATRATIVFAIGANLQRGRWRDTGASLRIAPTAAL
jgi:hypothetical protein